MDTYDLFGEDGSGMLEGLADLTGGDSFVQSGSSELNSVSRDAPNQSSFTSTYNQPAVPRQESTLQKLASFGGSGPTGSVASNNAVPGSSGAISEHFNDPYYRSARPAAPQQYAPQQYHPEAIYGMPEQHHPSMTDMGGWQGGGGGLRGYPTQTYRHPNPYEQPKLHQYPQQQPTNIGMPAVGQPPTGYIQNLPHYPQQPQPPPQPQQLYPQQPYPAYNQVHSQSVGRINQHLPYHQQLEMSHQYGHMHGQTHGNIPMHQGHGHQSMPIHQAPGPQPQTHQNPNHQNNPISLPPNITPMTGHPNPPHQPMPNHQNASSILSATIPNQNIHPSANVSNHPNSQMAVQTHTIQPHQTPGHPNQHPMTSNIPNTQTHPIVHANVHPNPQHQTLPVISNATHPNIPGQPSIQNTPPLGSQPMPSIHSNQPPNSVSHSVSVPSNSNIQLGHLPPYSQTNPHQVPLNPSMGFVQHPHQRGMDLNINTANQYTMGKVPPVLDGNSPQYRTAFPQLSPQMSPRAQMSPRSHPTQVSPRPVMSPAKPPNMSPHPHVQNTMSPRSQAPQNNKTCSPAPHQNYPQQQSTLQALEQMVMPSNVNVGNEHVYHGINNPTSPVIGSRMPVSPQQWNQMRTVVNVPSSSNANNEGVNVQNSPSENSIHSTNTNNEKEQENSKEIESLGQKQIITEQTDNISENAAAERTSDKTSAELEIPGPLNAADLQSTLDAGNEVAKTPTSDVKSVDDSVTANENVSVPQFSNINSDQVTTTEYKNDRITTESHSSSNSYEHQPSNQVQSSGVTSNNTVTSNHIQNNSTVQRVTTAQASLLEGSNIQNPTTPAPNIAGNLPPHSMNSNIPLNSLPTQNHIMTAPPNQLNSSLMPATQINPNNLHSTVSLPQTVTPMSTNHQSPYDGGSMLSSIALTSRSQLGPVQGNSIPLIPTLISHGNIAGLYQTPISHHQERAALQQQLQEIFHMPPSSENQDKMRLLQDRLNLLQQHETNDKCNGGTQCLLQNPTYNTTMVESPQVSSTTGRGRNRGPSKPRKPRQKKSSKVVDVISNKDQLPVSEDCVTAGTGLKITPDRTEVDAFEFTIDNAVSSEMDTPIVKTKKPRSPRKPRERKPKVPKEPKPPKAPKIVKESVPKPTRERKRLPKDPNAPRKKNKKKVIETTVLPCDSQTVTESKPLSDNSKEINSTVEVTDSKQIDDSLVTDFDDIPVSKIPIKELLEEAEARREKEEVENSKRRSSNLKKNRLPLGRKPCKRSGGKKRKRGGIVPESDGEPDDLITTPPPSPPAEGDCDSSKRRSARNTHRKKYTDDVMLRLSDDEFTLLSVPKIEKELKPKEAKVLEIKEPDGENKEEIVNKPNYVYINTSDEDSMIVQHILISRIGKRELIPDAPKVPVVEEETSHDKSPSTVNKLSECNESNLSDSDADVNPEDKSNLDKSLNVPDIVDKTSKGLTNEKEEILVKLDNPISADIEDENKLMPVETVPPAEKQDNVEKKTKLPPVMIDVEEFYIKYRNFSYLHCEWKTEDELYKGDKRIYSKIKRFRQKQAQQLNIFECFDDEPFNPDYIEVERVLDVSEHTDPGSEDSLKHYLVKWKSLQYEDSTWELEDDVDMSKVEQYKRFNETPTKEKWKFKKRPSPDQWKQLTESPVYNNRNTLRPYQLEGLNWLLFSWYNGSNCILADEMGLGKTIQSLTFINSVWEYGIRGPFLVIAPLSTIPNWQREFESWTDMNVVVYHGSQQSKNMIQEYEMYYKNEKGSLVKEISKFNVLITTFEIIVTDFQDLKMFNWRICVIDEAHRLKNRNCKLLEGLRQLHLEHRLLLSGTPLQNNVNELFSLLNFLEPTQFSSSEAFLSEFGQLKSESEVLKLQALLKPMMLRRLKEDVEKTLAPKEETIIEVELTNIQKKYYRGILERNFSFLEKGTASAANIPNLMNTMMELRKCCIHPYLLNGAEDQIQYDYKQQYGEDHEVYYKALIQSSGKMVLVDKLLPKLKSGGHRVLIFSQMVRCLDILEDYLIYKKYPYERIDGRIRGNVRQEAIDRYSKPDSDRFVFLLCTKAGGLGINLTAADTVIIYDSDWNPQNDLQAQARCHRIGQQKMVKIYRLICCNTYEREMFDKASMKLGLDKAVLQSMNTSQGGKDAGSKQLSKKEIEDLLKKGAYGAVMDEDNAGDKFCEEDIDIILARRTRVIQMESEKGSTFSKASFASSGIRSDIDIDDPDFWKKWAKKADINPIEKKDDDELLLITEPRRRTQIKRYGHDDGPMEISDMESSPDMSDDEEEGIGLRSKKRRDRFGKKTKRYTSDEYVPRLESSGDDVLYGNWSRSECFKIERGLLTFGWARWEEILDKNQFRRGWTTSNIEDCARIIVLFCLRHYKGDEKIINFIWDLIEPCENGEVTISRNHSGLHNPVPRGRNAKKKLKLKEARDSKLSLQQKWEDLNHWSSADKYDCETYLESSYKKHLFRHTNKVLLRVRLMYYIKHEVIGDYATRIADGLHASVLGMRPPAPSDSPPPRLWWDAACDTSLLVGTYIHGYENYLAMRTDPQLCFVDRLGPPDDAECSTIKNEDAMRKNHGNSEGDVDCELGDDVDPDEDGDIEGDTPGTSAMSNFNSSRQWPSMQDLNTRLRRLITSYQRSYKREELKMQQRAKKQERRERMEQMARDEVTQWRWTRADEESFRCTVASYGVEFDPVTKSLRWGRFRGLAQLDSKCDDALTDYLKAFMAMCKRQCGLAVGEAELPVRADLRAEPIGEDRAIATLERIDLLRVLREEIATHQSLDTRLNLCEVDDDTPPWWQPGIFDKLLVLGVCKHGLGDTYHKLFCDPKLPFTDSASKWSNKSQPKQETSLKSNDKDDTIKTEQNDKKSASDDCIAIRRSKRKSQNSESDQIDDDKGALFELESLARLAQIDNAATDTPSAIAANERLPQTHWFSERAIETRLHHIAHAVQNGEWPGGGVSPSRTSAPPSNAIPATNNQNVTPSSPDCSDKSKQKKNHIAIDVETERAKLHALLSAPPQQMSPAVQSLSDLPASLTVKAHSNRDQRDDCSSDSGSRRSTPAPVQPAPPPAHQRAPAVSMLSAQAAASGPVDLSAPLDLSEVQDFSLPRRSSVSPAPLQIKSKLDDTLIKLMKKKNAPEPEQIIGKERKRRKLDEIVLGLSAARGKGLSGIASPNENARKTPVQPSVTLTPAPPPGSEPAQPSQKPFSVTVTSVPSPQCPPKDLTAFLQQSFEQQAHLLKQQKQSATNSQKRQYESLLAEVNKAQDQIRSSYSHESKVNKWLAEQTEDSRRRKSSAVSVAPSSSTMPERRLTGDEHVPVVNRLTGKRLSGSKAPLLKHLTQWIAENPLYDMDPKWTENIKESIKLPQETRPPRVPSTASAASSSGGGDRKKVRPPSDSSTNVSSAFPSLASQNLAGLNPALLSGLAGLSAFDPKTLAATLSNLASFDPKLLNAFDPKLLSNLSSYDPKTNPLLMPFNTVPNVLGNMSGGSMFANLAGLGLSGFGGMDLGALGMASEGASCSTLKNKLRKGNDGQPTNAKGTSASSSQFPFLFPNHSLLYPPLGLGGLNPFGLQSGVSPAYDALAQCGILNGNLNVSSASSSAQSTSQSASRNVSKPRTVPSNSALPSASTSRHQKSSGERQQQAQLQQLLLPHDAYLLESLTKQASAYDAALKINERRNRESDKREMADLSRCEKKKSSESYRSQFSPELVAVQERLLKSTRGDKRDAEISKMLFEQMASGALSASLVSPGHSKKSRESDAKTTPDPSNKSSGEFASRGVRDETSSPALEPKMRRDESPSEPENLSVQCANLTEPTFKKDEKPSPERMESPKAANAGSHASASGEMDLEDLIAPTTVLRSGGKVVEEDKPSSPPTVGSPSAGNADDCESGRSSDSAPEKSADRAAGADESKSEAGDAGETNREVGDESEGSSKRAAKRRGKRSRDEEPAATGGRELRSSAGRQAAAAAARRAAAARQDREGSPKIV